MAVKRLSGVRASSSPRLRNAREALLSANAEALIDHVRGAMCERTRTQIVRLLSTGSLSVGELASALGRSKSATSQHLRVLREGGVVTPNRRGRAIVYSLTNTPMVQLTVQVLDRAVSLAAA
jgi:DNA-binding transcriptional ArsR family regulator